MKYLLIVLACIAGLCLLIFLVMFSMRTAKNVQRKKETANAYAIINVESGLGIRVKDAQIKNDAPIILFAHKNWECMTWQMIGIGSNVFLLKNLYTQKSFQPDIAENGTDLLQRDIGGSDLQHWEFLKQDDSTYLIRLENSELYLTASGDKSNDAAILCELADKANQHWTLHEQHPLS